MNDGMLVEALATYSEDDRALIRDDARMNAEAAERVGGVTVLAGVWSELVETRPPRRS